MVAIKDMEKIPKACCDDDKVCPLFNGETGTCNGAEEFIMTDTTMKRFPNCPLVDIEERKVGKWIYDKTSQNWRCSVCNETPKTLGFCGTADFMEKEFTFCNHCGSEMVGAENG